MTLFPEPTEQLGNELKARLKKLFNEADTTVIQDIKEFQVNHQSYINSRYYPFKQQFEMYFSILVGISYNLNYLEKKSWPINRGFQSVIATHSLKQFYSAYELFLDGFYEDAIALLRSVYESFLRILFISCNPKAPYNAYSTKGETGPKFNATNFVKSELGLKWENYSIMSAFAHSNKFRVMGEMVDNVMKGQKEPVSLKYEKDDDMISVVVNYFLFMFVAYLRLFNEIFTINTAKYKDQKVLLKRLKDLNEYATTADLTLKNHSANNSWREVGYDLDRLFELVKVMDKSPNAEWKKEWAKIKLIT